MPEFTVTSPYVDFRSPESTPHMYHWALSNPMPESASSPSQELRIWSQPTFIFSTDIPSLFHKCVTITTITNKTKESDVVPPNL